MAIKTRKLIAKDPFTRPINPPQPGLSANTQVLEIHRVECQLIPSTDTKIVLVESYYCVVLRSVLTRSRFFFKAKILCFKMNWAWVLMCSLWTKLAIWSKHGVWGKHSFFKEWKIQDKERTVQEIFFNFICKCSSKIQNHTNINKKK